MAFRITNIEEQFAKNQAASAIAPVQTEIETVKTSIEIAVSQVESGGLAQNGTL